MNKKQRSEHHLQLRVRELTQLFNSLDPTPFFNKDLNRSVETFVESWALGHAPDCLLHIHIHFEELSAEGNAHELVTEAFHNHFDYKVGLVRSELKEMLRQGRISLMIGIAFVATCLISAEAVSQYAQGSIRSIARESLTIIGWVAMWRPVQIFLYDWWPLARRIKVYANLRRAKVHVIEVHKP